VNELLKRKNFPERVKIPEREKISENEIPERDTNTNTENGNKHSKRNLISGNVKIPEREINRKPITNTPISWKSSNIMFTI
jgi:hypothetical protein